AAAVLGAGQLQLVAQHPEQRRLRRGFDRIGLAVDVQIDGHKVLPDALICAHLNTVQVRARGQKTAAPGAIGLEIAFMDAFPAFFPLAGRTVAIVGEGAPAEAKARLFAGSPARLLRIGAPRAFDPAAYEDA